MKIELMPTSMALYSVRMRDEKQAIYVEVQNYAPEVVKVYVTDTNGMTCAFRLSAEAANLLTLSLTEATLAMQREELKAAA